MKNSLILILAVVALVCAVEMHTCMGQNVDPLPDAPTNRLSMFKEKLKLLRSLPINYKVAVLQQTQKIRDDIKLLWDDALAKADDMKGWTSDMYDSFKRKLKEELEKFKENMGED